MSPDGFQNQTIPSVDKTTCVLADLFPLSDPGIGYVKRGNVASLDSP